MALNGITREQAWGKRSRLYDWGLPVIRLDVQQSYHDGWDDALTNSTLPQVVEALEETLRALDRLWPDLRPESELDYWPGFERCRAALKAAKEAMA